MDSLSDVTTKARPFVLFKWLLRIGVGNLGGGSPIARVAMKSAEPLAKSQLLTAKSCFAIAEIAASFARDVLESAVD